MSFALIKRIPVEPNVDFIGKRKAFAVFSTLLVLGSIALFLIQGLNFGVDFRGGILLEARTAGPADLAEMRSNLDGLGLGEVTLQHFGEPTDVLINIQRQDGDEQAQMAAIATVKEALADKVQDWRRTEFVGPKVGGELKEAGFLATVLSLLAIGIYIWFRFEWQFGVAALAALMHDVIATVGFFSLIQVEFNLATLAAILMIAGYSINDTVVLFDRVRECMRKYKKLPVTDLLNLAINQTLSRTLLTSVTTLLALIALFLFGGQVIQGFTIGLIWGVLIGTYSSIGLAIPLLMALKVRRSTVAGDEDDADAATAKAEPKSA